MSSIIGNADIPADILWDIALDQQQEWRAEDREWLHDDDDEEYGK